MITTDISGRFGNNILCIFRCFLYASIHNINFNNIVLDSKTFNKYPNILNNIKDNFKDNIDVSQYKVIRNTERNNLKTFINGNVRISDPNYWIYPNSAEEFELFGKIFVNKEYKKEIINKYSYLFDGYTSSVGFTIRRGDFLTIHDGRHVISDQEIIDMINNLDKQYEKTECILITSDDTNFVISLLNKNNIYNNKNIKVIENNNPEEQTYILSLCTQVINNGCYYLGDRIIGKWESTFGQIAQCLNRSYNYI